MVELPAEAPPAAAPAADELPPAVELIPALPAVDCCVAEGVESNPHPQKAVADKHKADLPNSCVTLKGMLRYCYVRMLREMSRTRPSAFVSAGFVVSSRYVGVGRQVEG
jgi:hypothetical protein